MLSNDEIRYWTKIRILKQAKEAAMTILIGVVIFAAGLFVGGVIGAGWMGSAAMGGF